MCRKIVSLELIGYLLSLHFTLATVQVDPDLFDGRTRGPAIAQLNPAEQDAAPAASDPKNVDLRQAQAQQAVDAQGAEMKAPAEAPAQTAAINSVPEAAEVVEQVSEVVSSVDAGAPARQSASVRRKFEGFSVGGGTLHSLPEKSSKRLNLELEAFAPEATAQSSQTATKGAQRSADVKSINRDRGTDLPTNL